jgi:pilus assembly protein CpaF
MGLAERLATAQQERATSSRHPSSTQQSSQALSVKEVLLTDDPHGTLKQVVHASLLATLGPKLYDAELTPSELETMVRDALTQAMASHDTPLTSVDRTRLTQEIPTTSWATARSSRSCATPDCQR